MGVFFYSLQESYKSFWSVMDFFQSYHALEEAIWLLHWKLFVDLHCWCFLTGMMIFSLVIPHFSLAHVSGVCGMNIKSFMEMMNERRCHYYVFGSLLQSCRGLEAIWLLHWELFGDLYCLCFLRSKIIFSLVIPHSLLQMCLGVFHNL